MGYNGCVDLFWILRRIFAERANDAGKPKLFGKLKTMTDVEFVALIELLEEKSNYAKHGSKA